MVRQIAHIVIPPREKRAATLRFFIADATPEEELDRGILFGLFNIDYYHHRNEEIIESVVEELQSRYYDPDITTREPEGLLEETLRSLNTTLAQLIENEQIFLNLKRFHAVIGVLRGKALTFTHLGDIRVYLMHQSAVKRQTLTDLLDTTEARDNDKKSPPLSRIFSHLVSGSLRTNDAVLFATSTVTDYCSKEQLQKILATSTTPPRALEQIRALVRNEKGTAGALCFLLRLAPEHEVAAPKSSEGSLATLQATEDEARRYLAPSLVRNALRQGKKVALVLEKALRTVLRVPKDAPRQEVPIRITRTILATIRFIGRALVFIYRVLGTIFAIGKDIAQQKQQWRTALSALKEQSRDGVRPLLKKGKEQFGTLSLRQRTLIIAASLIAVVLVVSTITLGIQRSRAERKEAYEKNIALINERINTAEASLLFKDEQRTQSIYNEARTLIDTLPRKTKEQKTTYDELVRTVTQHLEKLRHVIPLASVDVVKDFYELDPAGDMQTIAIADTTAYVAHGTRPLLYKVNLENKQVLTLDASDVDVRPIRRIAFEEKNPLLYLTFDTAGLAALNLQKQSVSQTDITFGQEKTRLDDITLYNKRLYVLDGANNAIWRHEKKDAGFGKGVAWLKASVDLTDARAFTIDGAVWIVQPTKVIRLLQGKETSWSLGPIDPPALSLRSVIANNGSAKLWLLDESGKRVLAVEKDSGKLLAQYPLPADDIRDFSVNEKTGEILLLTKTKLLKLTYEKE